MAIRRRPLDQDTNDNLSTHLLRNGFNQLTVDDRRTPNVYEDAMHIARGQILEASDANRETTTHSQQKTLKASGSQNRSREIRGAYKIDKSLETVIIPRRNPSKSTLVLLNSNSGERLRAQPRP